MLVIRLRRTGSKKRPFYRVVVAEKTNPREGSFVEVLGDYNPRAKEQTLTINRERLDYWLGQGAKASDSVRTLVARVPAPPAAAAEQPAS